MNTDTALDFLRKYQPMPPDSELTNPLIQYYDEVRKHFVDNPDPRCLPLFLQSFGEGDGLGVYQLVEDVFRGIDAAVVTRELQEGLVSRNAPTRYWSAQIAAAFPSAELCDSLCRMLQSSVEDERAAAAIALGQIKNPKALGALNRALTSETSPHIRGLIMDLI